MSKAECDNCSLDKIAGELKSHSALPKGMAGRVVKFKGERERLNEIVMKYAGRNIKRFYSIDAGVYEAGALPKKHKELMGLVGSLVLRCDDCITYHVIRSHEEGASGKEIEEALAIGLVIGVSITIPHMRRAMEVLDELKSKKV